MSFKTLGLSAELLRAINEQGYDAPTPIQAKAIPVILGGEDVMAAAQTGTGKTAGFVLPLLERLSATATPAPKKSQASIRALILAPTRELAAQVEDSVKIYGKYLSLKSAAVFGGVKIGPQIAKLRRGVDILVATPGRLMDLLGQKAMSLSQVEMFVLDEADRMLDMGFITDIRQVIKLLPHERQNLLFSATFSPEIKTLAKTLLHSPVLIEMASSNSTAEGIEQEVYLVDRQRKRELLSFMIGSQNWQQVLVFTRTKHGADNLARQLGNDGLPSEAIHSNKSQGARTRALADFKQGKVRVLVATDIAARGLDINKLPHVVNFDLPNVAEDYVHRIGRTGRAQNKGAAISLVSADELYLIRDIEKQLKCKIPQIVIPGYEPTQGAKNSPKKEGQKSSKKPSVRKAAPYSEKRETSRRPRDEERPSRFEDRRTPRFDDRKPSRPRSEKPKRFDEEKMPLDNSNRMPRFDENKPIRRRDDRAPRFDDRRPSRAGAECTSRFDDRRPSRQGAERTSRFNDRKPTSRQRDDRAPRFDDKRGARDGNRAPRFEGRKPSSQRDERSARFDNRKSSTRQRDDRASRFDDRKSSRSASKTPRFDDRKPTRSAGPSTGRKKPSSSKPRSFGGPTKKRS